jgi:hypothetical protein
MNTEKEMDKDALKSKSYYKTQSHRSATKLKMNRETQEDYRMSMTEEMKNLDPKST